MLEVMYTVNICIGPGHVDGHVARFEVASGKHSLWASVPLDLPGDEVSETAALALYLETVALNLPQETRDLVRTARATPGGSDRP